MLARVGIRISVRTNEFATFYSDIQIGNFDLTSMNWVGINDPNHYYMVFDSKMIPPTGYNRGAYANSAMDRLVEAGAVTLDPAERKSIYAQVQQLAAEQLPYVSLWWDDTVAVMNRRLAGFQPYPERQPALARDCHGRGRRRRGAIAVIGFLARRILAIVPVALGVATLTFALIHLVPGDPVVAMLGENAAPADIAGMRHRSVSIVRSWSSTARSWAAWPRAISASRSRIAPVARLIAERFPATLELAGGGTCSSRSLVAFPLGLIAGARPGGAGDLGAMGFAMLGISVPHIYLGPLLMILFSLDLRMASADRARRPRSSGAARRHARHRARGDSRADAAPEPHSGSRE